MAPGQTLLFSRRGRPVTGEPGTAKSTRTDLTQKVRGVVRDALTLRQTCPWPKPRAQFAFKDSMIHGQCRSHYVSHFAAFFIVARAKISVVESCLMFNLGATRRCCPLEIGFTCVVPFVLMVCV